MSTGRQKKQSATETASDRVRLDKWLWAARLFKTRSIAKQAVEGGKVQAEGQKLKPGREIGTGLILTVRQGWDERTIEVLDLSEQRRSAPEAQQLYRELPESIEKREREALQRKAQPTLSQPAAKPDKRDRRLRQKLKQGDL
ncbi:MAG: RNA-binding S4 domain-containing protein [Pseudomonadota bacterium]